MSLSDQIRPKKDQNIRYNVYQPIVFYYKDVSTLLKKKRYVFPYYSQTVFTTEDEAKNFLPVFLKQLVDKGEIDREDVGNEELVLASTQELMIARLEVTD